MTDAEIKKALECCWHNNECVGNECPFFEPINDCTQLMAMEALDLINRQQAEIERLKKRAIMVEAIEDSITPLPFETDYDKAIKEAKSEAIKEFAERLKIYVVPQKADGYTREIIPKSNIDNLVKEMVGDAE